MNPDHEFPQQKNNPDHEPGRTARPDVTIRQSGPLDSPLDLACSHGAQSTSLPIARQQAMDVGEVTSHPIQLTEDTEREAKRARSQRIIMGKRRRPPKSWHVPHRLRSVETNSNYPMDEEDLEIAHHARLLAQLLSDPAQWARLVIGIKNDENSDKTGGDQRGAGHLQHVEEMKPPYKEYATPNLKNEGNFSELPTLPEQAFSCLKNLKTEQCMSDEFIDKIDKKAKLYFSKMKQHSEEEIVENGRQFMKDEALAAYRYYIAENDLFEAFDYQFGELLHHCFTVENHAKVYHHYNFTIEMKAHGENDWTSSLFFAEVKLLHGVKYYLCSPLKSTDHGPCYSCEKRHATELQHPPGVCYAGCIDPGSSCLSDESPSDDECD